MGQGAARQLCSQARPAVIVDGVDVKPFPPLPHFRKRGELVAWMLRAMPDAPEIAYVMAAGSEEELKAIRG